MGDLPVMCERESFLKKFLQFKWERENFRIFFILESCFSDISPASRQCCFPSCAFIAFPLLFENMFVRVVAFLALIALVCGQTTCTPSSYSPEVKFRSWDSALSLFSQ